VSRGAAVVTGAARGLGLAIATQLRGLGYDVLLTDVDEAAVKPFEQTASALNVPLKVVRDSYADGRARYEARMILVRPDQFIVWIGDSAPADAGAIMRSVAGRD